MAPQFQLVGLNAFDPAGEDRRDEPKLLYPAALMRAQQLKFEGIAFRVYFHGEPTGEQKQAFVDLGAVM